MRLSRGFITTAFKIREKATGKTYDCFIQEYSNSDGYSYTRFNIGINGWSEWNFLFYTDEIGFNAKFEIL